MYTISIPSGIIHKDGIMILADDSTSEYLEYVDFLKGGGSPEQRSDPVEQEVITVSAWQIRKALNSWGLRDSVEVIIAHSGNRDIIDGWQYAIEFSSDHPLIINMLPNLGITETEMYDLFNQARTM